MRLLHAGRAQRGPLNADVRWHLAKVHMRLIALTIVAWLSASAANSEDPDALPAEAKYWEALDAWVESGGPKSELHSRVVDNCTKLALSPAGTSEWAALLTTRQDELDFRIAVCVKATAHCVRPQQEFLNPMFVDMICHETKVALYRQLCIKANLRPSENAT